MSTFRLKERKVLYDEPGLKLEFVHIMINDQPARIYRQYKWSAIACEMREFNKLPQWWQKYIDMDELKIYEKEYYIENKEKMLAYARQWKIKNKERWNDYQREYKRRKYAEDKAKRLD